MNWFVYDSVGKKYGPYTDEQLRQLAVSGKITHNTLVETDTGNRGMAGQLRGLFPMPGEGHSGTYPNDSIRSLNKANYNEQTAYVSKETFRNGNINQYNKVSQSKIMLGKRARPQDIRLVNKLFAAYIALFLMQVMIGVVIKYLNANFMIGILALSNVVWLYLSEFVLMCFFYRMWCQMPDLYTRLTPEVVTFLLVVPFVGRVINVLSFENCLNKIFREQQTNRFTSFALAVLYSACVVVYAVLVCIGCAVPSLVNYILSLLWFVILTVLKKDLVFLVKSANGL